MKKWDVFDSAGKFIGSISPSFDPKGWDTPEERAERYAYESSSRKAMNEYKEKLSLGVLFAILGIIASLVDHFLAVICDNMFCRFLSLFTSILCFVFWGIAVISLLKSIWWFSVYLGRKMKNK